MIKWFKRIWNKIFGNTILGTYLDSPYLIKKKKKRKKRAVKKSTIIVNDKNETNPLDVDLIDDNISNKDRKEVRTFTKRWVDRILTISLFDIQLVFILAFMGKEQIAETLGVAIVTEIVGVVVGYYAKSYLETYSEKKNDLEIDKMNHDYSINTDSNSNDNTDAFG